jgi:iron complex outermembrane receptor protein
MEQSRHVVTVRALSAAACFAAVCAANGEPPADDASADAAPAQPPGGEAKPKAPAGSADDLLAFEEVPMVVSASRLSQPISQLAVPVSVLTSQDIHFRGVVDIAELLTQVPGMDTIRVDRNRWAVGMRGLHHELADRTIVLINGRDARNPLFGVADFGTIPVLVQDIERIEVVRGPGGAAWGANAFNGVINIITKRPEDSRGFVLSSRLNEFGDTYNQVRWGDSAGKLSWRGSFGYEEHDSSDKAIHGDDFFSRDFARTYRYDAEGVYAFGPQARLRFGAAGSHTDRGDAQFAQFWPMTDERLDNNRFFARLEREFGKDTTAYVQWYGHFFSENRPELNYTDTWAHDIEGQVAFRTSDSNRMCVGGNARLTYIAQTMLTAQDFVYPGAPAHETWLGAFVVDRWQATERLALEGQARVDDYSGTGVDWSARLAALYSVDEAQHHVLRVAAAKAFRAPLMDLRDLTSLRSPLPSPPYPPDLYAVTLLKPDDLQNEEVYALEAGYTARVSKSVEAEVNVYYQRYTDLIGVRTIMSEPYVGTLANNDGGDAYGLEAEVSYTRDDLRLYGWYAYNAFDPDQPDQDVRGFYPAEHKIGAGARWRATDAITLNADYRFTSSTETSSIAKAVESSHRLDVTVTALLWHGKGEVQVGVLDVFNETEPAVAGVGNDAATPTPGRSLFVSAQIKF